MHFVEEKDQDLGIRELAKDIYSRKKSDQVLNVFKKKWRWTGVGRGQRL